MKTLDITKNIIDNHLIPNFTISNGEICGIFIKSNFDIDYALIDYLTEKKIKKEINIIQPFYQVKDLFHKRTFLESLTKKHLVRKFIKNKLKCSDQKVLEILDKANIGYDWSMYTYEGNARRKLSTLIALENNKNILYDTSAINVEGMIKLHALVKKEISEKNGCAIEVNFFPLKDSIVPLKNYDTIVEIKSITPPAYSESR